MSRQSDEQKEQIVDEEEDSEEDEPVSRKQIIEVQHTSSGEK